MGNIREVHIGQAIKAKVREQGRTSAWLARQIPCTPNHLYKIYSKSAISTDLLVRISKILGYNFFEDFVER